jgi:hypothetical protein
MAFQAGIQFCGRPTMGELYCCLVAVLQSQYMSTAAPKQYARAWRSMQGPHIKRCGRKELELAVVQFTKGMLQMKLRTAAQAL